MAKTLRRLFLLASVLLLALATAGAGMAQGQRHILYMEVDGLITPVTQKYVVRGLERAEHQGASLVVIRLDTPGGLLDATRAIVEGLLNSPVPTVVFVGPKGARAASAGTFITAAANVAAMAPGTNIGAATPVGGGGEDLPKTLASKATEDAAALIRSVAQVRGRNGQKLEDTVRKASSFTAQEAVELNVADLVAQDLPDLLRQLNGRIVSTPRGDVTIDTVGVEVRSLDMSMVERLLDFLSSPNIVFLLFSLGSLALLVEIAVPGHIVPGVVGAMLLILAFLAAGNLSVNWAGVALILLAMVLLFLELFVAGFGALGIGAVVSLILGGFLLFFHSGSPSPTMPRIGVSLWLLLPTAAILVGGGGWVLSTMVRSRKAPSGSHASPVLGATGYVVSELSPRGTVQVASELWSAVSEDGVAVAPGQMVQVTKVEGALLTVAVAPEPQGKKSAPG
ncbi:MAG: nodulation protein NfeD [Chloroflexi bacterium]|nr:nodulation protein NfeD [Chloroflexota bacterium]